MNKLCSVFMEHKKILLFMRNTLFLIILTAFQAIGGVNYAQSARLSLDLKNTTVKEALQKIEKQSEFYFLYNSELINVQRKVDLTVHNQRIDDILAKLFEEDKIKISITERHIVLSPLSEKSVSGVQQELIITGTVKDANGGPLPGVSIVVKGTTIGTITNAEGKFSLSIPASAKVLVFSSIGMKPVEVVIGSQSIINVTMENQIFNLDDVVVVGYGVTKKRDLTGAVSSIKSNKLIQTAVPSISNMLSGKVAGLQVWNTSAQPGGNVSFLIRGASNSALIVIDGVPITAIGEPGSGNRYTSGSKDDLTTINPDDIESVEVLKDASATAIYGSRSANGVVLITTKRGSLGGVKVNYDGSTSYQVMAEEWNMLNASEFLQQKNLYNIENAKLTQKIVPYGVKPESSFVKPSNLFTDAAIQAAGEGTDWLGQIIRNGSIQKHNISLSGGTDKMKYFISANIFDQKGIVKSNGLKKFSGRANFDQEISKYVKVGLTATMTRENHDNVPIGAAGNENAGVIRAAIEFNPNIAIKDVEGKYLLDPNHSFVPNPVSLLEIDDNSIRQRLLASSYLEVTPIKELKLKLNVGVDNYSGIRNTYLPKTTLYGAMENGKADIAQNQKANYLFDATANYTKLFKDKHNLTALAGYSYQEFNWSGNSAGGYSFLIDQFKWYDLASAQGEKPEVSSYGGKDLLASYFGRVNYNFDNKYLLTASIRADGASNFAKRNKWGYFPSVALGWVVSAEPFLNSVKNVLPYLKLRASYGESGNNQIGQASMAAYRTGANYFFNDTKVIGVYASQLENADLKWETTTEFNVGFDFGLFNNKLTGSVDAYNRIVSDLLDYKQLASYNEVSSIAYNVGKIQTKGLEVALNAHLINTDNFKWDADYNISLYRRNWKERADNWKPAIYQNTTDPLDAIFSYISDGLVQAGEVVPHMPKATPGIVKLKDLDGFLRDDKGQPVVDENGRFQYLGKPDGKLDDADRVFLGTYDPGYTMSLGNTFKYKDFDLGIFAYGFFDRKMRDATRQYYEGSAYFIREGSNLFASIKDAWKADNQGSTIPGFFQGLSSWGWGDYYLENAWFVRLKNVTLGYTLPKSLLSKVSVSRARLYLDAQNLFTVTPYKGIDPETDSMAGYPNQRTFSIGLSVTF